MRRTPLLLVTPDYRILACQPVLTEEYAARLIDAGLDPTKPDVFPPIAPDSLMSTCDREGCGVNVWLTPQQQAIVVSATAVVVMCFGCAAEVERTADVAVWLGLMLGPRPNVDGL